MKQWKIRPAAAALAAALTLAAPTAQVALGHPHDAAAELSYQAALGSGPAEAAEAAWDHPGRGRGGHGRQRDDDKRDDDEVAGQGRGLGRGLARGHARGDHRGIARGRDGRDGDPVGGRDCSPPWQNHGHYVSCVARGEVEVDGDSVDEVDIPGSVVREAAQSDVGKPHEDDD